MNKIFFSLFLVSLSSCVTNKLRKDYCRSVNAYKMGAREAEQGKTSAQFKKLAKECRDYDIPLDIKKYQAGRAKGLKVFCSKDKGYEWGLKGKKYLNICSDKKLEEEFLKGYGEGDKKCLYEAGYSDSEDGGKRKFASSKCQKLSKKAGENKKQYEKGYNKGLSAFCVYKRGYEEGLEGQLYHKICPKNLEAQFLKGYREGDKKCLYEEGLLHGRNGELSSAFSSVKCQKMSSLTVNKKWYDKGRSEGLKLFCTYKEGYNLGIKNRIYNNVCPKALEPDFFKGYSYGLEEYKKAQRQQELIAIERRKLELEQQRIDNERRAEEQRLELEREKLDQERKRPYQLCKYDSDCNAGGECKYNYRLKDYVCVIEEPLYSERSYRQKSRCKTNVFGTYLEGGGCNAFGCWSPGGGCNSFGCWYSGGQCTPFRCERRAPVTKNSCR